MYPGQVTRLTDKRIASAETILADADIILLTGNTQVETITPRVGAITRKAGQVLYLISLDGSITVGTSGNVVVGATILQNRYVPLIYSPTTGKWHPPIVA